MKKETILNKLTTINAILNNNELQTIINELKIDVIGEYKGFTKSSLQAQKAALAFLKKQAKTLKAALTVMYYLHLKLSMNCLTLEKKRSLNFLIVDHF